MEIERPPLQIGPEKATVTFRFSNFFRLTRLFDGVKVPQREPITLSNYRKDNLTTTCTRSSTIPTVGTDKQIFVDGHRAIQLDAYCYAVPTMPVAQEHLQFWQSQLKDRLQDELAQCIRTERCHLEFYMIYEKKGRIGPCIVLTCWDENTCENESGRENTRRKLQKKIRKLQSIRDCHFPCKVVVDSVSPLGRCPEPDVSPGLVLKALLEDSQTTHVSLLLKTSDHDNHGCTLGGLIRVGSRIYGLTVAHPFSG